MLRADGESCLIWLGRRRFASRQRSRRHRQRSRHRHHHRQRSHHRHRREPPPPPPERPPPRRGCTNAGTEAHATSARSASLLAAPGPFNRPHESPQRDASIASSSASNPSGSRRGPVVRPLCDQRRLKSGGRKTNKKRRFDESRKSRRGRRTRPRRWRPRAARTSSLRGGLIEDKLARQNKISHENPLPDEVHRPPPGLRAASESKASSGQPPPPPPPGGTWPTTRPSRTRSRKDELRKSGSIEVHVSLRKTQAHLLRVMRRAAVLKAKAMLALPHGETWRRRRRA